MPYPIRRLAPFARLSWLLLILLACPFCAHAQTQACFGPVFMPLSGNAFNQELGLGVVGGVRLSGRHIIEAEMLLLPIGGEANQTEFAAATAALMDPILLESFDPALSLIIRYRLTPFQGAIPGTDATIGLDLFAGAGLLAGAIEMSSWTGSEIANQANDESNAVLPAVSLGGSIKALVHPSVAIRLDLHAVLGFDQVLDYKNPQAASENRSLSGDANRLLCGSDGEARCTAGVEFLPFFGLGLDFYLPGA